MSKIVDFGMGKLARYRYIKISDSVGVFYTAILNVSYTTEVVFDHIEAWNNHVNDGVLSTLGGERVTITNGRFWDNSNEVENGTVYYCRKGQIVSVFISDCEFINNKSKK